MKSKIYNITLNDKVYVVKVEEIKEISNQKVDIPELKEENCFVSKAEVCAPMHGLILELLVEKNQKVKKGDVIIILESMKMENEIIAPVDGKIDDIKINIGQNVNINDVMLSII